MPIKKSGFWGFGADGTFLAQRWDLRLGILQCVPWAGGLGPVPELRAGVTIGPGLRVVGGASLTMHTPLPFAQIGALWSSALVASSMWFGRGFESHRTEKNKEGSLVDRLTQGRPAAPLGNEL